MGCVECKICKQEDNKSQFEFAEEPREKIIKDIPIINEDNEDIPEQLLFKIKNLGEIISEDEFNSIIPKETLELINQQSFPFPIINDKSYKIKPVKFDKGNLYYGQWNIDGVIDGYGKYYLQNDNVLVQGIWEKGQLKNARIIYPNGEIYEGGMKNSNFDGKGKLISSNKDEYTGEFLDGEKNGNGKIVFNDDETEYSGQFVKNNFNGRGVMKWNNGVEYEGTFNENFFEGYGMLTNKTGDKYEGNFVKNLFHGEGKYTYSNGDEYEGDFICGFRKGKGTYRKKDSFVFKGNWDNDVPNGPGQFIFKEQIIDCNFYNGNIIEIKNETNNPIDCNFFKVPMNLETQNLSHIENTNIFTSQYKAEALSFLED